MGYLSQLRRRRCWCDHNVVDSPLNTQIIRRNERDFKLRLVRPSREGSRHCLPYNGRSHRVTSFVDSNQVTVHESFDKRLRPIMCIRNVEFGGEVVLGAGADRQ